MNLELLRGRWRQLYLMAIVIMVIGCNKGDGEDGDGHDDHDHHLEHFVPEHYPNGLESIGEAIRARIAALSSSGEGTDLEQVQKLQMELRDLVEWAPEIAADTDLPERDWVPIYEHSEKIRKAMKLAPQTGQKSGAKGVADSVSQDCLKLSEMLDEAFTKLPRDILDFGPADEPNELADAA